MFHNRWLRDTEPGAAWACLGGGGGGGGGGGAGGGGMGDGLAAAYAAGVNDALAGRGELGYPAHEGGFGGDDGGFSGGGLGGDMSAFDAYAYSPDFSTPFGGLPDATNFSTQGIGLSGPQAGFTGGREGGGLADPGNFGFPSFAHGPGFDTGVWGENPGPESAGRGNDHGDGPTGGGTGPAAGGGGFSGGQQGGPTSGPGDFSPGDFSASVSGTSMPGLDNQLASMGWEGFNPHGPVPGMSNLNSWRNEQGGVHPFANFIQAGWSGQRLYTPEFLADTFTDVGTSPLEAYESLAGRGHVPSPMYPGVNDLNTGGGQNRPTFPGGMPSGGFPSMTNQGVQPFNGVQLISPNMIPPEMGGMGVMDLRTMRMMGRV